MANGTLVPVLPILEAYGADLVLAGYSHVYERSFLIDGHYGYSWEFEPSMVLDSGSGRPNEGGPYRKPAGGLGASQGTVYTVCGCSGRGGEGAFESTHPVMAVSHGGFGSMVLEIDGLQLRAQFLRLTRAFSKKPEPPQTLTCCLLSRPAGTLS